MKNKNACMIAISKRLKELWINYGIDSDKIFVAHDGVDLAESRRIGKQNKRELRTKLGLPLKKEIICYVGSLREGRGIEFILDAANFYKYKNYLFLIIGGRNSEINKYKNKLTSNNVIFTGYIENSKVPLYLRCADLLVMPYQGKVVTIDGCSPMKVFEYLASGGYILAPIFPSFYEVMKDFEGVTFYEPEDNRKFIIEIDKILSNPNALRFRDRFDKLDIYSWQNRAKKLLNIYFQFFELDIPPIIRERFN
jgi:glycosyltransferase involved in cell wall biosynthesis